VPAALSGPRFEVKPVNLPPLAVAPDNRPFVIAETRQANAAAVGRAQTVERTAAARLGTSLLGASPWAVMGGVPGMQAADDHRAVTAADRRLAELRRDVFDSLLAVEGIDQKTKPDAWKAAAIKTGTLQREQAVVEASKAVAAARLARWRPAAKGEPAPAKKLADAEAALAKAEAAMKAPPSATFTPRQVTRYPATSTGRRLALADWIADGSNPLTARVAVNHLWLRRFGAGLVPTVFDFGKNGQPPTHPKLLDWLAGELVARGWSLKELHRVIVTSATYRMESSHDTASAARDPDNRLLWRMPARRLTAEAVRDAVLFVAGELDPAAGGPELDQTLGMTVKRRSLYFRHAPEKQMVFLELFDAANPTECYRRSESVVPQQALALANSPLTQAQSRLLARKLTARNADDPGFVTAAFETVLSRPATPAERDVCLKYLADQAALYAAKGLTPTGGGPVPVPPSSDPKARARESLVHVLMNHNDFVTVR
jgi:hypothetical protein